MTALFASSSISSAFVFWHVYIQKNLVEEEIQNNLLFFIKFGVVTVGYISKSGSRLLVKWHHFQADAAYSSFQWEQQGLLSGGQFF